MTLPSTVGGLDDHLASLHLKLPLKYPNTKRSLKSHEEYQNQVAFTGRLELTKSAMVEHIAWKLANDLRTVTFSPVSIANPLQLSFRTITLSLPSPVYPHCIDVLWSSDNGGQLVVDMIDENYLWISLRLEINDFLHDSNQSRQLTLNTFDSWGHISVPYSFELRSNPYFLRLVDSKNVIVSLKDGGLLSFQRSSSLSDFNVFNCEEGAHFHLGGVLDSIFKSNKSSDLSVDGISSSAAIDAILVPDSALKIVATLTVNKTIKFWDLELHTLLRERTITPEETNSWLTFGPARYLQVQGDILTVHSLHHTKNITSIHLWDLSSIGSEKIYKLQQTLELAPPTMRTDSLHSSFSNDIWFIQDYSLAQSKRRSINVLWKSNNSSILSHYEVDASSIEPTLLAQWKLNESDAATLSTSFQDSSFFESQIFNTGKYNNLIVYTSMNVLREHANLGVVYSQRALRLLVLETIETISSTELTDSRATWIKLLALCEQFRNTGQEGLSFIESQGDLKSLAIQVDALSILRDGHYYQLFDSKDTSTEEGKLSGILLSLTHRFSVKTRFKIYQALLRQGELSASSTTDIYEEFIQSRVEDNEAIEYQNRLAEVSLKTIRGLVFPKVSQDGDVHSADDLSISLFRKLDSISTLRSIKDSHEKILIDLAIILLLFDPRDETVELLNGIVKKLCAYATFEHILCTCFNDCGNGLETLNVSKPENSIFWVAIVDKLPRLKYLLARGSINDAFDFLIHKFEQSYDEVILNVVVELLNCGEGEAVKKMFFKNLNKNRLIDRALIGLVYLLTDDVQNFCLTFEEFDDEIFLQNKNQESIAQIEGQLSKRKEVSDLLSSLFTPQSTPGSQKANYFHSLFELAKAQAKVLRHRSQDNIITKNVTSGRSTTEEEFIRAALNFEQEAIKNVEDSSLLAYNFNLSDAYLNLYELGLFLHDYKPVYESLDHLSPSGDEYDYSFLMKRFLRTLISQGSISTIFPPNDNKLFRDNYILIDSVLLELANNELVLASALTYYEYLYSWRLLGSSTKIDPTSLADKRGAAEALYMFITRFKIEQPELLSGTSEQFEDIKQYKLKILELYLIILNVLNSFDEADDQWIVKSQAGDSLAVVKLGELTLEYYTWLKEIKDEI